MYEARQEAEWQRAAWVASCIRALFSRSYVDVNRMNPWWLARQEIASGSLDDLRRWARDRLPERLSEAEKWKRWREYCNARNEQ